MREITLLGIDDTVVVDPSELQEAARQYGPRGGPEAWERGVAVGHRIVTGEQISVDEFQREFVAGYLNAWRCHFPGRSSSELLNAMCTQASAIRQLPEDLVELRGCDLSSIRAVFAHIDTVRGTGGTTASKTLSAMSPRLFVMWDIAIGERYGFAASATGYCRYLWLMAEVCRRMCQTAGVAPAPSGARELELRLTPPSRRGPIPLAKLLDEWNWLGAGPSKR